MPERTGNYGVGMYGIGARWGNKNCTGDISLMTSESVWIEIRVLEIMFFDVHVHYALRCWIYPLYSKYSDGVWGMVFFSRFLLRQITAMVVSEISAYFVLQHLFVIARFCFFIVLSIVHDANYIVTFLSCLIHTQYLTFPIPGAQQSLDR